MESPVLPPPTESRRRPVCQHCGAPSPAGDEFCCAGCAYVYRLIHDEGLTDYYKFRDDVTAPADAALQPERDFAWLADLQAAAELKAGVRTPELVLAVQGISCAACVWLIDRVFQKQPGAGRCEVNAQTGRVRLLWREGFDAQSFARALQRFNYLLGPVTAANDAPSESKALARRIGLAAAFNMNVMLFALPAYFGMEADFAYARLFGTLAMGFATLSLLAGGGYFLGKAWRALRIGAMHVDLPIAIGICGAYAGSFYGWISGREEYVYFDFVSGFILLMLIGRWAQVAAVERNQRRLLRLQPTPPRVGVVGLDGAICLRAPDTLRAGDEFVIGRGETVPVAARLVSDAADINLAWINGESDPRVFRAGQQLPSGAQNAGRAEIRLRATEDWSAALLSELLKPVERSVQDDPLVARVVQVYLVAIIA
ncbi:MAG: heavy metal translocating P-type ATPase metal-binding domain-containing protein, partial [Pseudomonadota bacterium]